MFLWSKFAQRTNNVAQVSLGLKIEAAFSKSVVPHPGNGSCSTAHLTGALYQSASALVLVITYVAPFVSRYLLSAVGARGGRGAVCGGASDARVCVCVCACLEEVTRLILHGIFNGPLSIYLHAGSS